MNNRLRRTTQAPTNLCLVCFVTININAHMDETKTQFLTTSCAHPLLNSSRRQYMFVLSFLTPRLPRFCVSFLRFSLISLSVHLTTNLSMYEYHDQ